MAIPTVFAPVKREDFTLRPFTVHKEYQLSSYADLYLHGTSSGYNVVYGVHTRLKTPIGSNQADNDPRNSFDDSYQHIIWQAYNHLYYKNPYDPYATFEHANKRYTYKFLNYSASIFSVPQLNYGEQIQPGSVRLYNEANDLLVVDDVNGNLYDPRIDTGSFTKRHGLVAYWGFNEAFRKFKYRIGFESRGSIGYTSHDFEPDEVTHYKNISFEDGVPVAFNPSGLAARFYSYDNGSDAYGYMITHDRPEFNFASNEDFTIAFWMSSYADQYSPDLTDTNPLITKRGVIRKQVYGVNPKYNQSDLLIDTLHVSSSIEDSPTDVYPYEFQIYNANSNDDVGRIVFRRSDGKNLFELKTDTPIFSTDYHHVAVTKSGSLITLYFDGFVEVSGFDNTINPINNHSIMFGGITREHRYKYEGTLDEIRMYNYAATEQEIGTLANNTNMSVYQTAVVGNVFYRQGNVVLSPLDMYYLPLLTVDGDETTITYKGTHTIYQYEVLCRVKKGSFNLTYNPSARVSPKSDLLIDDMTGSLLLPYATTIGMYNDTGDLVAVAKLGQPIQMRQDVDLNFLVRWDA